MPTTGSSSAPCHGWHCPRGTNIDTSYPRGAPSKRTLLRRCLKMALVVIEEDLSVVDLRPRRCGSGVRPGLTIAEDGRRLVIHLGHGSIERVHHLDVVEGHAEVVVTAWVGTLAAVANKTVIATMKKRLWFREVELSAPLGGRRLRDGAPELPHPRRAWAPPTGA